MATKTPDALSIRRPSGPGLANVKDAIAAAGLAGEFETAATIAHDHDLIMICLRCAGGSSDIVSSGVELWKDRWRVCISCKLLLRGLDSSSIQNPHGEINL